MSGASAEAMSVADSEASVTPEPAPLPAPMFAMLGDADAAVCVDGVCAVPEPADPS